MVLWSLWSLYQCQMCTEQGLYLAWSYSHWLPVEYWAIQEQLLVCLYRTDDMHTYEIASG